ncbi:MAG: DnaJ domain-containing protein [Chloroflexota bacterium]
MTKRDPHVVLGIPLDASPSTIKAAWRKLARIHHPDVAGADPVAARTATRKMAEINRAYEQLQLDGLAAPGSRGNGADRDGMATPKPARPTRPVSARFDTSETFRPRNHRSGPATFPPGQEPSRGNRVDPEPRRASLPNGPLNRARDPRFRPAPLPSIEVARLHPIEFGKFHGHLLGEIAAFEPSYIDWLARTISHDPDLVAAARALQADLDARAVVRRQRPAPVR